EVKYHAGHEAQGEIAQGLHDGTALAAIEIDKPLNAGDQPDYRQLTDVDGDHKSKEKPYRPPAAIKQEGQNEEGIARTDLSDGIDMGPGFDGIIALQSPMNADEDQYDGDVSVTHLARETGPQEE